MLIKEKEEIEAVSKLIIWSVWDYFHNDGKIITEKKFKRMIKQCIKAHEEYDKKVPPKDLNKLDNYG